MFKRTIASALLTIGLAATPVIAHADGKEGSREQQDADLALKNFRAGQNDKDVSPAEQNKRGEDLTKANQKERECDKNNSCTPAGK